MADASVFDGKYLRITHGRDAVQGRNIYRIHAKLDSHQYPDLGPADAKILASELENAAAAIRSYTPAKN